MGVLYDCPPAQNSEPLAITLDRGRPANRRCFPAPHHRFSVRVTPVKFSGDVNHRIAFHSKPWLGHGAR